MGTVKISGFIIALLLVGCFAAVFGLTLSNFNYVYHDNIASLNDTYDNKKFNETFNRLDRLNEISQDMSNATEIEVDPSAFDVLTAYFTSGYQAVRISYQSFGVFQSITDEGFELLNLGSAMDVFKATIITIVIVLLVIGVLIRIIVKVNKL